MVIGITGASGRVGRLAAEYAAKRVPAEKLVLFTRTPESLADFAERGIDVRRADFEDSAALKEALEGVTHLFMVSASNFTGRRTDQHGNAIRAAAEAGVEKLVFLSMPGVEDSNNPIGLAAEEYRDAELQVIGSGMRWAILRNGPYTELHVVERLGSDLSSGVVFSNAQDGRAGFVSRRDVAEAAIGALLSDAADGRIFDVSGPEMLTFKDITQLLSAASGRPLEHVDCSDAEYEDRLRSQGFPDLGVRSLTGMGLALRGGYFDESSNAVLELTGRPPVSVAEVLQQNREALDLSPELYSRGRS
jgi:NAD(P)H dehydrogenase (quinone)